LNVPLILYRFYKVTFLDTIKNTCFHGLLTMLCALFPRFVLTSLKCVVSRTEHQKLSVHLRNSWGLQLCLLSILFISVNFDDVLQHSRKNKRKKEIDHTNVDKLFSYFFLMPTRKGVIYLIQDQGSGIGNLKYNHRIDFYFILFF